MGQEAILGWWMDSPRAGVIQLVIQWRTPPLQRVAITETKNADGVRLSTPVIRTPHCTTWHDIGVAPTVGSRCLGNCSQCRWGSLTTCLRDRSIMLLKKRTARFAQTCRICRTFTTLRKIREVATYYSPSEAL